MPRRNPWVTEDLGVSVYTGVMSNTVGLLNIDPASRLGQFRALAGDTSAVENAETPGFGTYKLFSDVEIETYLSLNPDNIYRAVADGYNGLASTAAVEAKIVKDYDLQVDLRHRSNQLSIAAARWYEEADKYDLRTGSSGDHFVLADYEYVEDVYPRWPEAAPHDRLL